MSTMNIAKPKRRTVWDFIKQQPLGFIGLILILIMSIAAIFSPEVAPYHTEDVDIVEFVDLLTEVTGLFDWKEYFRTGIDRISGQPFYGDAASYSYAIEWHDPEKDQILSLIHISEPTRPY